MFGDGISLKKKCLPMLEGGHDWLRFGEALELIRIVVTWKEQQPDSPSELQSIDEALVCELMMSGVIYGRALWE